MGVLLQRATWIDQAADLARTALPAATAMGYFRLYDELLPHLFNPTFFRGVAGIGYTLLRLAALTGESKIMLPCVLRWALEG
jgi:lantibiotic modifying enzyme